MSYTPTNWKSGDTITAEKLNHIEDGIEECCSDKGYECIESRTSIFNDSVTTAYYDPEYTESGAEAELVGAFVDSAENPPIIKVTFNGAEYVCEPIDGDPQYGAQYLESIGGPDWSKYPFLIELHTNQTNITSMIFTETEGVYSVKIEALDLTVSTSPYFKRAVASIFQTLFITPPLQVLVRDGTLDKTAGEIREALSSGSLVYVYGGPEFCWQIVSYIYNDRTNAYDFYLITNSSTITNYRGIGSDSYPTLVG